MIFGNKGVKLSVKNSRELLVALWNAHRPECPHQLTGETKGWKIASARAPTRLHRCAVCDKWLHTGLSRFLPCWKAAGYASQNDPLYIANCGCLVRDLRSTWIARARRENLASCLPQERFERCQGGKSELIPVSVVLERRADGSAQQGQFLSFSSSFCRRPAPHRMSSRLMKHRFREVVYFVLWDARRHLACIARHGLNLCQKRGPECVEAGLLCASTA